MPATILSDNGASSGTSGIKTTGASDGQLALQTTTSGGVATTAITLDTVQNATFAKNIGLGGTAPTTSGTGISFPATQSASTDANTLDDYEEGTFTPSQGAGLTVVGAFSSSGTYTKIGRIVYVQGIVGGATSVAFSSGNAVVCGNLPFTNPAPSNQTAQGVGTNEAANATAVVSAYSTNLYSQASLSATKNFYFSVVYLTNT